MRVSIGIGGAASGRRGEIHAALDFAVEAERLGVDSAWSAEAWGSDAVGPLAFLAARTSRLRLGTGILQITARVPAMTAMTAATLQTLSAGRFLLGLGASGPQVVEGLHGVRFERPLVRLRETVEIVRAALRGDRVEYEGDFHQLPLQGGEGKALRLAFVPAPIPLYLATLAPRALVYTGAVADGWLGTSFVPEVPDAHLAFLREGAERAGRSLADIDLCAGGPVAFGDDVEGMIDARRPGLAFVLGAMGSARTNFYNDAFRRAGYEDACVEVQRLWLDKRREEAAARVPDELVMRTSLFGTEAMIRERIRVYRDAGITTLRADPMGADANERLATLGRLVELVRQESG